MLCPSVLPVIVVFVAPKPVRRIAVPPPPEVLPELPLPPPCSVPVIVLSESVLPSALPPILIPANALSVMVLPMTVLS